MSCLTECSRLASHATTEFTIPSCVLFSELSSTFYGHMKFNDVAAHLCWMSSCCTQCAINASLLTHGRLGRCVSWQCVFTKEAASIRNIEGCWPAHSWLAQGPAWTEEGCELIWWRCCKFWQCVSAQIWTTRRWRRWRELSWKFPGCELHSQSIKYHLSTMMSFGKGSANRCCVLAWFAAAPMQLWPTYKCQLLIRPAAQAERQKRWRSKK